MAHENSRFDSRGTCDMQEENFIYLEENSWPLLDAYSPDKGGATVVLSLLA
jgi:hypothetical protein